MASRKKENRSGGSAAGGGMDYQAEAYTFVAANILAEHPINWFEANSDQIPIAVQVETGSGGDDLVVELKDGTKVEIQVKSGLRKGNDLWDAILSLASAIQENTNTYGLLLVNEASSRTIQNDLRLDIIKLGQGVNNDLHDIGNEFVQKLVEAELSKQGICSRLRIQVWDFDPGSQGEELTLQILQKVIQNSQQVKAARSVLVSDGMDLIKVRGRRDANSLEIKLEQVGIELTISQKRNFSAQIDRYLKWCADTNKSIFIPHLQISLPISLAWNVIQPLSSDESDQTNRTNSIPMIIEKAIVLRLELAEIRFLICRKYSIDAPG